MPTRVGIDPPPATSPLAQGGKAHDELTRPTFTLIERLVSRLGGDGPSFNPAGQLLLSMRDCHESIRVLFASAEVRNTGAARAAAVSSVLLARPQVESAFVGMILGADKNKYPRMWIRSSWVSQVRGALADQRQFGGELRGRSAFLKNAEAAGIEPSRAVAVVDDRTGHALEELSAEARPFPNPSESLAPRKGKSPAGPLVGTIFEPLARLLHPIWRHLCDPSHVGAHLVVTRAALRTEDAVVLGGLTPHEIVAGLHREAFGVSITSMLSLCSAYIASHYRDVGMMADAGIAWDQIRHGDPGARGIYDGWAKAALHLVDATLSSSSP